MADTALVTDRLKQQWREAAVSAARELTDSGVVDTGVVFDASVDAAAQLVIDEVVRRLERENHWLDLEFPRYEMVIDGKSHWLPMHQAGPASQQSSGRNAFIDRFLSRDRIFSTDHFYKIFEEQARANLIAERETW